MFLVTIPIFVSVVLHQSSIVNGSSLRQKNCLDVDCNFEEQYCAGKLCLDHSKCLEDADCLNNSNRWFQPMCAGSVACKMSDVEGEPGQCGKICDKSCKINKDCGEQQYCTGSGVCLDRTTCRGDKDCLNPSNIWSEPTCPGSVTCEDGSCGKSCDKSCETNEDCSEQQYCGGNICHYYSTCQEDVDCLNPSNMWGRPKCIGFDKCKDGVCRRKCGYRCEDKSEPVKCLVSPCEENKCDEGFSCVDDYCGGCNAIVFDTGGNTVCTTSTDISDNTTFQILDDDSSSEAPTTTTPTPLGHHYVPFETPPKCIEKCSETDMTINGQCDFETMGGCNCVTEESQYCFYSCRRDGIWAMACQQLPSPPNDGSNNNMETIPPTPEYDSSTISPTTTPTIVHDTSSIDYIVKLLGKVVEELDSLKADVRQLSEDVSVKSC